VVVSFDDIIFSTINCLGKPRQLTAAGFWIPWQLLPKDNFAFYSCVSALWYVWTTIFKIKILSHIMVKINYNLLGKKGMDNLGRWNQFIVWNNPFEISSIKSTFPTKPYLRRGSIVNRRKSQPYCWYSAEAEKDVVRSCCFYIFGARE